jgi:hypothetical protein
MSWPHESKRASSCAESFTGWEILGEACPLPFNTDLVYFAVQDAHDHIAKRDRCRQTLAWWAMVVSKNLFISHDLWLPANHPADLVRYPNGSTQAPVRGDIVVWGSLDSQGRPWPAGPNGAHGGHTAVVAAVTDGYVVTAEQNVKWGTQDHPTDRLALTQVGNQWILSGSQTHVTQLPTYRWPSTMGDSRATYGWLHSVRNTGHFPSPSRAVSVPAPGTGTSVPQQPSGGLPSLAASTVITSNGELADLVWTTSDYFAPRTSGDVPHAAVRSLGAPPYR